MNFTKPWSNEDDDPIDWLNSARVFAAALGFLLKENEGIVIAPPEYDDEIPQLNFGKSIVYASKNQIHVIECDEDLKPGQMVWMHDKKN